MVPAGTVIISLYREDELLDGELERSTSMGPSSVPLNGCVVVRVSRLSANSGRGGVILFAVVEESNVSDTMSAVLYRCTDDPTWSETDVSSPPINFPLIWLPFLRASES